MQGSVKRVSPRSAVAGWESSAFAQQRPAQTSSISAGCACREELSLYLALPGSKRVLQPPVSPHLFAA